MRPVYGTPVSRTIRRAPERGVIAKGQRIKLLFALLCFCASIGLLLYHPFFRISVIDVSGLVRLDRTEFHSTANAAIEYNRLLILPERNFFLVSEDTIYEALNSKYPLDELSVTKLFPNKIQIDIAEKISTVIFDTGEEYVTVDLDGVVIEQLGKVGEHEWFEESEITTTTLADGTVRTTVDVLNRWHTPDTAYIAANYGQFPVVHDSSVPEVIHNEQIIDGRVIVHAVEWYKHLQGQHQSPVAYMIFENNGRDLTVHLTSGQQVLTRVLPVDDQQMMRFDEALKQSISLEDARYIDVRFVERVYAQ